GVDQKPVVWGKLDRVRPVAFRENDESGSVKIYPAVVHEVGVLPWTNPACPKPNLSLFLIHSIDAPDHPLPLGDLILDPPASSIAKVKVVPAVALGHPEDLLR